MKTLLAALLCLPLFQEPPPKVDFVRDIQPVFKAACLKCHGSEKPKGQFRVDSRPQAMKGGVGGKAILPGNGAGSLLVRLLVSTDADERMPRKAEPLPKAQIDLLRAWIDQGAEWPDSAAGAAKAETHWAYVKPARPTPPASGISPIDAFIRVRLDREGLRPAPEAPKATLIRRVSLDLIGLPPGPKELDEFLADPAPDAYVRLVDRLLASPHYGERWARPWLDLARYADTNGYEKDRRRSAWMYRDWVIDALNRDLSFRDFTIQQIAGDMLPEATTEQQIATGFHRNTLLNQEGGIDVEEARWETLVDRVNTTATVWLGTTLACAQCHNHKFDPFSQKDYYRMLAFFDNSEYRVQGLGETVVDKWIVEPELELAPPEVLKRRDTLKAEAEALKKQIDSSDLGGDLAAWEVALASKPPRWTV